MMARVINIEDFILDIFLRIFLIVASSDFYSAILKEMFENIIISTISFTSNNQHHLQIPGQNLICFTN